MQTDEDVGKVNVAVPALVSKCIELFLESLVLATCEEARKNYTEKSVHGEIPIGRKLLCLPGHVKLCVQKRDDFDFLRDRVRDIPDPVDEEKVRDSAKSPRLPNASGVKRGRQRRQTEPSITGGAPIVPALVSPLRPLAPYSPQPVSAPPLEMLSGTMSPRTIRIQDLVNPIDEEPPNSTAASPQIFPRIRQFSQSKALLSQSSLPAVSSPLLNAISLPIRLASPILATASNEPSRDINGDDDDDYDNL
jgi:hypothetical protein